ncbi:MAG TPA: DUF4157 domain-containing protein [Verrucomicrobiae bacterium]|nr:DUF4157 domain-containing protein [Verrucomicrobiae bacterium]
MDGSFQTLEKAAEFHNRAHHRKSSEKDHNSFFNLPSQAAGNLATQRLFRSGVIQPKLAVSQPGDVHEQEADRIAEQVMRMPEPGLQRACAGCDSGATPCPACEEKAAIAQCKADHDGHSKSDAASDSFVESLGSGRPLDPETRDFFEPRFGADLSHVRVHTDALAAELARAFTAQAYTVGRDVVFAAGQYAPGSNEGRRLLAHELTHVVQQADGQGSLLQRQLSSAPAAQPLIGLGAGGPAVEELQRRLNEAGTGPALDVDGMFGEHTRGAVMLFQQSHGLVADGVVGRLTWAALGGSPTGPSEATTTVTTGGAFEQATVMDSTFQETAEAGVEKFAVDPKECFEQHAACYDCCEKLHPWWKPWEWRERKSCKTDCCDSAFHQCMRDGTFPCLCKS